MLRFVIFATLMAISLAKVGSYNNRFRRNEGNENSVKYYRPKYVYKFHEEDEDEESVPHHVEYKTDYKHYFNNLDEESGLDDDGDQEEEVTPKHYSKHIEAKPEKVTYYGYHDRDESSGSTQGEGVQKDTEHHVEIKHEHGTSHQSFKMHHFHPAQVFIKKQDLQHLKKPIEIGVTKHEFKVGGWVLDVSEMPVGSYILYLFFSLFIPKRAAMRLKWNPRRSIILKRVTI